MNRKRPLVAHGPRDWMPCKHRGSGSSSPVSSLRLSRFCDSSIQELWSLPPLCRGTAQTWRGWMMSGHQEVGGPGRHPLLLPGGAVLGRVPLAGPLDIFLSTHHLARAWDSMSHSALCCFFLGQKQIAHQIIRGGATSVENEKITHYFNFRFNILQSTMQDLIGLQTTL